MTEEAHQPHQDAENLFRHVRGWFVLRATSGKQGQADMSATAEMPLYPECSDRRITLILDYIRLQQPPSVPGLKFFAMSLATSESHLRHKFKEVVGMSFGSYVRRLRFLHARKLLEAGGVTVKQARLEIGLLDHSSFTKAYKRYFGETPTKAKARGDDLRVRPAFCLASGTGLSRKTPLELLPAFWPPIFDRR